MIYFHNSYPSGPPAQYGLRPMINDTQAVDNIHKLSERLLSGASSETRHNEIQTIDYDSYIKYVVCAVTFLHDRDQ